MQNINDRKELNSIAKIVQKISSSRTPSAAFVLKAPKGVEKSKSSPARLGVFSASFNPLTIAHLKLVEISEKEYSLDETALLLAKDNVDKDIIGMQLIDRLLILKIVAQKHPHLSVILSSHGRFVEKAKALMEIYPSKPQVYFIVGFDTLLRVFDPKYYSDMDLELQTLFSICRFIASNRGDNDMEALKKSLNQEKVKKFSDKIDLIHLPKPYSDISSTELRHKIKSGQDVSDSIPKIVSDFISTTNVYRNEEVMRNF